MSLTFISRGSKYPYVNTGSAIASGDVVVLNSGSTGKVGVAQGAIAATTGTGTLDVGGVQSLAKKSGEAFTDMQLLYWNTSSKYLTGTASGSTLAGRAWGTASSSATTANVLLNDNPLVQ
jgi:predicted RecA/RadA family phage recombinase